MRSCTNAPVRDFIRLNMYIGITREAKIPQKVKPMYISITNVYIITIHIFRMFFCRWIKPCTCKVRQSISLNCYPHWIIFLLFAFSPALGQRNTQGTSVVIHMTCDSIVVGADSRGLITTGIDTAVQFCKIKQIGNTFFTTTGNAINDKIGFDLSSIACKAWTGQNSIFQFIQQFDKDIILPIHRMASERIRDTENRDSLLCTIEFYCFEGDYTRMFMRSYRIRKVNAIRALIIDSQKVFFSRTIRGYGYPVYAGESAAIVRFVKFNPDVLANNSSCKIVDTLLSVQAKRKSKMTYPPFDIVCIKPDTAYWLSQKNRCEPIKPYRKW